MSCKQIRGLGPNKLKSGMCFIIHILTSPFEFSEDWSHRWEVTVKYKVFIYIPL